MDLPVLITFSMISQLSVRISVHFLSIRKSCRSQMSDLCYDDTKNLFSSQLSDALAKPLKIMKLKLPTNVAQVHTLARLKRWCLKLTKTPMTLQTKFKYFTFP